MLPKLESKLFPTSALIQLLHLVPHVCYNVLSVPKYPDIPFRLDMLLHMICVYGLCVLHARTYMYFFALFY